MILKSLSARENTQIMDKIKGSGKGLVSWAKYHTYHFQRRLASYSTKMMGVRRDTGGVADREIIESRVKYFEVLN